MGRTVGNALFKETIRINQEFAFTWMWKGGSWMRWDMESFKREYDLKERSSLRSLELEHFKSLSLQKLTFGGEI